MKKFTKNVKGSIALFLSMIILLLVILEGFLIDGSKVLAAKMMMSSAGDMALNAGLTHYDEALRDIYGLFAVSETEEELTANLKAYYQKTLGESVGGEDSGGYTDQLLGYIEQMIQTGWNNEEAGKLLDMQLSDDFSASGVEQSELSNPPVLKSQILEYMKYRGPASLGYGMLEKLHMFKQVKQQQKAMEGKLNYEEKMSDVQKACEEAYENIDPYNKLLDGDLNPDKVERDSHTINENIHKAIVAAWCLSLVSRDIGLDPHWERDSGTRSSNMDQAFQRCILLNSMSVACEAAEADLAGDFSLHPSGAAHAAKVIIGYVEEFEAYQNLYTTWQNYLEEYEERREELEEELDGLDDEEDESEIEAIEEELEALEAEKDAYEEQYNDMEQSIEQCIAVIETAKNVLKEDIDSQMKTAADLLNSLAKSAEQLKKLAENGKSALDDVIRRMGELETLGESWQSSISSLENGDIKTSMQLDKNNKAEALDRGKIEILQGRLDKGIEYGDMLLNAAKVTSAVSFILYEGQKSSYSGWLKSRFEGTSYGSETQLEGISYQSFDAPAQAERAKETGALSDGTVTVYFLDPSGGQEQDGYWKMNLASTKEQMGQISAKEDEFFKYLERVCPKSETDKASKKDGEAAKESLLEKGGSVNLTPEESLPSLPADVTGAGGGTSEKFDKTDSGASNKNVSKNAKENTQSSANFLEGIGELLEKGRDKLYLSEYATKMFSCYTTDKQEAVASTLSGYAFTADHNQMYKAEVEYILWGNTDGTKDVQYTLATIFGVRFLLNSLYAFTGDPEIRQVSLAIAASIAGWTGFGVPLVQSVVILGFALAETALDLEALKKGESVPIYKSTSNWMIKPSGFTKEAIEQAVDRVGSAAKKYLFEQLDQLTEDTKGAFKEKLNEYTNETIDNIVSSASAAVLNPLQERITGLVNVVSSPEVDIAAKIGDCISGIENTIKSENDSVMKTAKMEALKLVREGVNNRLVTMINAFHEQNMTNDQMTQKVKQTFDQITRNLNGNLKVTVKEAVDPLVNKVDEALNSTNENLQKNVSEAMDDMLTRINCGIAFADTESINVDGSKGRTSASAALTMNYQEYLWMFIAVQSIANEDAFLKRIGNLIQANLAASNTKPSPDFNITGAYSFLQVDASADLSTTFFSMPVPVAGGGGTVLGQDSYSVGYHGILGY